MAPETKNAADNVADYKNFIKGLKVDITKGTDIRNYLTASRKMYAFTERISVGLKKDTPSRQEGSEYVRIPPGYPLPRRFEIDKDDRDEAITIAREELDPSVFTGSLPTGEPVPPEFDIMELHQKTLDEAQMVEFRQIMKIDNTFAEGMESPWNDFFMKMNTLRPPVDDGEIAMMPKEPKEPSGGSGPPSTPAGPNPDDVWKWIQNNFAKLEKAINCFSESTGAQWRIHWWGWEVGLSYDCADNLADVLMGAGAPAALKVANHLKDVAIAALQTGKIVVGTIGLTGFGGVLTIIALYAYALGHLIKKVNNGDRGIWLQGNWPWPMPFIMWPYVWAVDGHAHW